MRRYPVSRLFTWLQVAILLVLLYAVLSAVAEFTTTARVTEDRIADTTMRVFTLWLPDGAAITVMGSRDLPIIHHLGAQIDKRIPITLGEGVR